MSLPTAAEAVQLTEEAIERSAFGVDASWLEQADGMVRQIAKTRQPFSSNDVWAAGLPDPGNRRALGYVLRQMQAEGYLRLTGERVISRWGHGQTVAVWVRV